MKQNFLLNGNAETILKNMELKCLNMIGKLIIKKNIKFKRQIGKPTFFRRRKIKDSQLNLSKIKTIDKIYDFLRMLDAPDYPSAFIKLKDFKITFNDIRKRNNIIDAKVKITQK